MTHFACGVGLLKYLRGFQNERNKLGYIGNHKQSSGCKCQKIQVSPGQPFFHPMLWDIPPLWDLGLQNLLCSLSAAIYAREFLKSRKMQKKHIRSLSFQASCYWIRRSLFLWMGTERETGLEWASVNTSHRIPLRKSQASVGPVFPDGRFQCFSVVTTVISLFCCGLPGKEVTCSSSRVFTLYSFLCCRLFCLFF